MRPILALLLAALVVAAPVRAQDGVPDTLEWRGYVPLAPGNAWQYRGETWDGSIGTLERWYETWRVAADTVVEHVRLFRLTIACDSVYAHSSFPFVRSCRPERTTQTLLRYDEPQANIVERVPVSEDAFTERLWWTYDFRLDAAFGLVEQGSTAEFHYERGEVVELDEASLRTTVKTVAVRGAVPGAISFGHGVGLVHSRFEEGGGSSLDLVHALVDGRAYGRPVRVGVERAPLPQAWVPAVTHPNPTAGGFTLSFGLSAPGRVRATVVDALGRVVTRQDLGHLSGGAHRVRMDAPGPGAGVYVLTLHVDGRPHSRTVITRIRL